MIMKERMATWELLLPMLSLNRTHTALRISLVMSGSGLKIGGRLDTRLSRPLTLYVLLCSIDEYIERRTELRRRE